VSVPLALHRIDGEHLGSSRMRGDPVLGVLIAALAAVMLALAAIAVSGSGSAGRLVEVRSPVLATPAGTWAVPSASVKVSVTSSHTVQTIGYSVEGRPITLETFGMGSRHVLLMGGMHGDEYGAPVADAFVSFLRTSPTAVPAGTELDVLACANPDGRVADRRTNAHNVDLNRNFPASNWSTTPGLSGASPGSEPESEAETVVLVGLMEAQRYDRVISLHSAGGLLDWDGPGGWTIAKNMSKASGVRMLQLAAYHGSMGTYVPEHYHIPIVTWELSRPTFDASIRSGLLASLR
jgi:protein MpaA